MTKHLTLTSAILSATLLLSATLARAQSQPDDSVFQQFGGKPGIDKVVGDFLPLLLADVRINENFKDVDMERLGVLLAEQFCQLTGGPCKYSGKQMQEAHRDMQLNNAQFNALAEDLQLAMEKNGIANAAQNRLVAKLAPMQRQIVTK